jgi:hypothetical protein
VAIEKDVQHGCLTLREYHLRVGLPEKTLVENSADVCICILKRVDWYSTPC